MQRKDPEIIFDNSNYLVSYKKACVHTAPLIKGEDSVLSRCAQIYPSILQVKGKKPIEGGLVNRLDYETSGLVLIAKDQKTYEHFIQIQEEGRLIKNYRALCLDLRPFNEHVLPEGFPEKAKLTNNHIESAFRPWGPGRTAVRPTIVQTGLDKKRADIAYDRGKYYRTLILGVEIIGSYKDIPLCIVQCELRRGFRHQLRAHLAWAGLPLLDDTKYNVLNTDVTNTEIFFLEAYKLTCMNKAFNTEEWSYSKLDNERLERKLAAK
jgi:23S rRNA pseudouridine1911/1915/1917 synthase